MNFTLIRGRDFSENLDFKNAQGKPIALPSGSFRILLERGTFAREYTPGAGLTRMRNGLVWKISAQESNDFEFTTMYYTLYLNDNEIIRGILRIQ